MCTKNKKRWFVCSWNTTFMFVRFVRGKRVDDLLACLSNKVTGLWWRTYKLCHLGRHRPRRYCTCLHARSPLKPNCKYKNITTRDGNAWAIGRILRTPIADIITFYARSHTDYRNAIQSTHRLGFRHRAIHGWANMSGCQMVFGGICASACMQTSDGSTTASARTNVDSPGWSGLAAVGSVCHIYILNLSDMIHGRYCVFVPFGNCFRFLLLSVLAEPAFAVSRIIACGAQQFMATFPFDVITWASTATVFGLTMCKALNWWNIFEWYHKMIAVK